MAAELHKQATARLDRVDELPVGTGRLDLTAYLRGDLLSSHAGVSADYEHCIKKNVSVFGQGWLGTNWAKDTGVRADYGVLTGLRLTF